jgi:hypothetical protein
MQITAWLYPKSDRSRHQLVQAMQSAEVELISARYGLRVGSPVLERALEAADGADGLGVSAGAILSKPELESLPFRELMCRNTAPESPRDHELNHAACAASPLQDFGAEEPIRLFQGLSLSRVKVKPNFVAGVGEWTDEYVLGTAVQRVFAAAGLSGYSLVPVVNPKTGSPWPEIAQIHSSSVLPGSMRDASIERIESRFGSENGKLRLLGCLAYAPVDLEGRPDFNRTGEPWRWWGLPSWVVSARVEHVFKQFRLRGWAFRPVFVGGSKLYAEYLGAWHELRRLVCTTAKSSFEGGRW